jgi:hypothetical protein
VGFTSDGVVIGMDPHKRSATIEVMSAALTLEDLAREAYDGARHDAHYRTGALDKPNGRALTGHHHTIRSSRDRDSRSDTARFNRPAPLTGRHQQPEAITLRSPAEGLRAAAAACPHGARRRLRSCADDSCRM